MGHFIRSVSVRILTPRNHQVMRAVMILTGHQTKKPKPFDPRNNCGIITGNAQCNGIVTDLCHDHPALILRKLRRMCRHHPLQ